jgi:hypothetical protein
LIAELHAAARIQRDDLAQLVSPLQEGLPAQITAVTERQIESKEH